MVSTVKALAIVASALILVLGDMMSPAISDTPLATTLDPSQGWIDEDNQVTVVGRSFTIDTSVSFFAGGPYPLGCAGHSGQGLAVVESRAFVAAPASLPGYLPRIEIFDVEDPTNPVRIGSARTTGVPRSVAVKSEYAFVTTSVVAVQVFDVSSPDLPSLAASSTSTCEGRDIAISGDYAYVACSNGTGLQIFDVSDPLSPRLASFGPPGAARSVHVSGDRAYVAHRDSLHILDVSDPRTPIHFGTWHAPAYTTLVDVTVNEGNAFVTALHGGVWGQLYVIDVSDPVQPLLLNAHFTPYRPGGLAVSDGYIFLAASTSGLIVRDLQNTAEVVGRCDETYMNAKEVVVSGSRAYVADRSSGLRIVDVSDPRAPVDTPRNPPLEGVIRRSDSRIDLTVPEGFAPGPYNVRVSNLAGCSVLRNAYRECHRHSLSCELEPRFPDTDALPVEEPLRWRLRLSGDEVLFGVQGGSDGYLLLPSMSESYDVLYQVIEDPRRAVIELYVAPETGLSVVLLSGRHEETVASMWEKMRVNGTCALPRIDERTFGDTILRVFPYDVVRMPGHLIQDGVLRYRYEFLDGRLDAAFAHGQGADLRIGTKAWDEYHCEYVEEESFTEMLRERCAELTASDPRLARHCAF